MIMLSLSTNFCKDAYFACIAMLLCYMCYLRFNETRKRIKHLFDVICVILAYPSCLYFKNFLIKVEFTAVLLSRIDSSVQQGYLLLAEWTACTNIREKNKNPDT